LSNRVGDIYRQIEEPALRVLYRYWDETRGTRNVPDDGTLDPARLPVLHGSLAMIETAPRLERFRVRYFGETLRSRFSQERRDMTFAQISRIGDLPEPLEGYWTTYEKGVVTYLPRIPLATGAAKTSFSRLLLPIMGAGSVPSRILCGFAFFHTRNRSAGKLAW
jgi:hypothetical protein